MVKKIELFVEVMASGNRSSSSLGKRKSRDDFVGDSLGTEVEVEAPEALDSVGNVSECPGAVLAPVRVKSTYRFDTKKKCEDEESESETESSVTPKCEKHKIPSMTVCPPAPRKPKSTPAKRNPAIIPCRRALHFPSDSPDLDILFGSDHQHQKKKLQKRASSSNIREDSQS